MVGFLNIILCAISTPHKAGKLEAALKHTNTHNFAAYPMAQSQKIFKNAMFVSSDLTIQECVYYT